MNNPGRFVGLIYVLVSIPGAFALVYVPGKLIVDGNATATAANIAANETLFRLGIACNIVSEILFMWVALALYDLLKGVNRRQAGVMLALIVVSIPIVLLNELNAFAALMLVHGSPYLLALGAPERNALAMLFLNLRGEGFGIAEIFWGLWLFPLGLLVYRSGFIPRIFAILLIAKCFYFLIGSLMPMVFPEYAAGVSHWIKPFSYGELLFMAWLLIMGARPPARVVPPALAPA